MSPGRSMGKAFRPSQVVADPESADKADNSLERATRIRAYSRRVQMRLPLFEDEPVGQGPDAIADGR